MFMLYNGSVLRDNRGSCFGFVINVANFAYIPCLLCAPMALLYRESQCWSVLCCLSVCVCMGAFFGGRFFLYSTVYAFMH